MVVFSQLTSKNWYYFQNQYPSAYKAILAANKIFQIENLQENPLNEKIIITFSTQKEIIEAAIKLKKSNLSEIFLINKLSKKPTFEESIIFINDFVNQNKKHIILADQEDVFPCPIKLFIKLLN